jgi:hypothetical protein
MILKGRVLCALNHRQDADDALPSTFRELAQKDSAWEGDKIG